MKKRLFMLVAFLLFFSGVALAEQLIGVGGTFWSHGHSTPLADGCVTIADGSSVCELFAANENDSEVTVIKAINGAATCAWGSPAVALNADANISAGGSFSTGAGAGFILAATGDRWDERPNAKELIEARTPGMSDGFCPNQVAQQRGHVCYAPCRVSQGTTDCTNYGGGTCEDVNAGHLRFACLRLVCDGAVFVSKQKVGK